MIVPTHLRSVYLVQPTFRIIFERYLFSCCMASDDLRPFHNGLFWNVIYLSSNGDACTYT